MDKGPEIRIIKDYLGKELSVYIDWFKGGDKISTAKSIQFEEREMYEVVNPVCRLSKTAAQQLMDDLWTCGVRPSEGQGSAGQLAAIQEHLKDMKVIVSKKLGVEL